MPLFEVRTSRSACSACSRAPAMNADFLNTPPLGVSAIMLPSRSIDRDVRGAVRRGCCGAREQQAVASGANECDAGAAARPAAGCRAPALRAPRASCRSTRRAPGSTTATAAPPAGPAASRRSSARDRRSELERFRDHVDVARGVVAHRPQVEARQHPERLHQHGALRPCGLAEDLAARERDRHRSARSACDTPRDRRRGGIHPASRRMRRSSPRCRRR